MGKRKNVRRRSRIGRFFAELTARPGEEPVFEEPKTVKLHKEPKPKVNVKELKAAADAINSVKVENKRSYQDAEQEDIDSEFSHEYSSALDNLNDHTEQWKKTGETGLYIDPPVTMKDRFGRIVRVYREKKDKIEAKRWVDLKKVPLKPNRFLQFAARLSRVAKKKKRVDEPSVKEVYEEVERVKSRSDDELDKIYKQLEG